MAKTILITGGTGLVGKRLTELLQERGYHVKLLSRKPEIIEGVEAFKWDIKNQEIDTKAFENVNTVIHLAGAGVADKKWTSGRKKEILDSRTLSTQLLWKALHENTHNVESFISASAIGYYGYDSGGIWKKEDSSFGDDFLATVTKAWESEIIKIEDLNIRTVMLRIGIVLSQHGGALKEIGKPIKWGIGSPLATGDQFMSWIHIDDLCHMFIHALDNNSLRGPYNAVAPNPVTNKGFSKQVAETLKKPFFLPNVPAFVLKLMVGEMASMIIGGSRISSEKIESAGFKFKFPDLPNAIRSLFEKKH